MMCTHLDGGASHGRCAVLVAIVLDCNDIFADVTAGLCCVACIGFVLIRACVVLRHAVRWGRTCCILGMCLC